jgi:hypothetical protein
VGEISAVVELKQSPDVHGPCQVFSLKSKDFEH